MQFSGQVTVAAPVDRVWDFLIDPTKVGMCGPGVESVEVIDSTTFKSVARVGIGRFRARFTVNGKIVSMSPPTEAVLQARGSAPGSAVDATATMKLLANGEAETVVDWAADVKIGGVVASIGARLIEGTARKMIAQTFECVREALNTSDVQPVDARDTE